MQQRRLQGILKAFCRCDTRLMLQVTYTSPARPRWGGTFVTVPKSVTGLQLQVWPHLLC